MAQYRGRTKIRYKTKHQKQKTSNNVDILLDSGTLRDIKEAKRITEEEIKYQWDCYSELARQRNEIILQIKEALVTVSQPYQLKKWQRAIKYKYSLHPLSTNGSLIFNGGRFNTGNDVNTQVPIFPALYLAKNKDTALQEHLGQVPIPKDVHKRLESAFELAEIEKLDPRSVALNNAASETIVSVSGQFDKVLDLCVEQNLEQFVDLIKSFEISPELVRKARELEIEAPAIVKNTNQLLKTLLLPNWRVLPSRFAVPANSQIFGHLVYMSGIEGIIYPSKLTSEPCIAIYPKNFGATDSFVQLDDEPPHPRTPRRIDSTNWRICEQNIREIIE